MTIERSLPHPEGAAGLKCLLTMHEGVIREASLAIQGSNRSISELYNEAQKLGIDLDEIYKGEV